MARGKGKRGGGRGTGRRFAAESAEEIEERNRRLAEFDAERARRRQDDDDEDGGGGDDDDFDSSAADAQREAMEVGRRVAQMSMKGNDDDDDDEDGGRRPKGIIEVDNPNKPSGGGGTNPRMMKIGDLAAASSEGRPMTRKEREEADKARAAADYRKRHEAGLTEEYKRDMAKLAEVRKRREAAQQRAKLEQEATEAAEDDRRKKAEAVGAMDDDDDDDDKKKKKKKKVKEDIPKLDKIAIKKMKPAQMKEALKARGLDIQGNAKQLTERLLKYETER